jgi:pyrimidine deaminase RibD-like protein
MTISEDVDNTPVVGSGIVCEGTKPIHYKHSRTAVDKAKLCPIDPTKPNPPPRVAIVLADGERMIGWAAKGHGGEVNIEAKSRVFDATATEHAEEALLRQLAETDLSNATAYITLEPCTSRSKGAPCVDLLMGRGIRTVFVGNSDPHPDISKGAWRSFLPAGVRVLDFAPELRNEARRDNAAFFDKFTTTSTLRGSGAFDYTQGDRVLGEPGRQFRTHWTKRGENSIAAYGDNDDVCVAAGCKMFSDIDDPGRWFEDSAYAKHVDAGQIVIFRRCYGYALVLVRSVRYGRNGEVPRLDFAYEIRYNAAGC